MLTKSNSWKWIRRIGIAVLILCVLAVLILKINRYRVYQVDPISQEVLDSVDLSEAKKLMIVAHPDDETLWGGGHLSEGGYLVVCITHGSDSTRSAEFYNVIEQSGNQGIMLSYPDKVNGQRDDWEEVKDGISQDLSKILALKSWDLIVTHNEAGEYGHIHHKMTHQIVLGCYEDANCTDPLYVFGTYHRAAVLSDYEADMTRISDAQLAKKEQLLELYSSQKNTIEGLSHMNPYEEWTLLSGQTQAENTAAVIK